MNHFVMLKFVHNNLRELLSTIFHILNSTINMQAKFMVEAVTLAWSPLIVTRTRGDEEWLLLLGGRCPSICIYMRGLLFQMTSG